MTTERRGLFALKTSEDGTKCAAECPQWRRCNGAASGPQHAFVRTTECEEAESAAREAAKEAFLDGYRDGEADERMRASRRGES